VPELAEQQRPDTRERDHVPPVRDVFAGRRFTFVLAWATFGGAERHALPLACHLRERGAVVDVCSLTDREGEAPLRFAERGIPWRPLPFEWPHARPAKARALAGFAWRLRRLGPDVLMPFCSRPNILCGLAWRAAGASLCVWHQQDVNPVTRFSPLLLGHAARATPLMMSNCRHGIDHLVSVTGAPRERIHYAPNGLELPLAAAGKAEWRSRLRAREGDFVAAMVAHLRLGKDYETLLRAWRLVRDALAARGRRGVLAVGGTGPVEVAAKALAFDLGLGSSVRFLGHVEDVGGLLSVCDAGVLSSLREGCPNWVLECMAVGLPVTGTDIPGIREAVGPDGYGFLAPPGDAPALADAVVRIADDRQEGRRLGERYAARVREEFSVSRMLEGHTGVLERALVGRMG
jgi:glycosyltransferase involved in cell wall biosynthesis